MKIKIAAPETCIVTAPMPIPEPPKPTFPTRKENAALAMFIRQINAPVAPAVPTPEEYAALAKFVEQLKRGADSKDPSPKRST